MQDAEKLQLAVEQMQQILDKAHQIVHDPNLPNLLAAYDVARDCIQQCSQDAANWKFSSRPSRVIRLSATRDLRYVRLFKMIGYRVHARRCTLLKHLDCVPPETPRLAPLPAA